jgi:hypothetical protein
MEVEESFRVLVRVRPDDRESYSCCVELEDEHTCVVQTADGRRQIRCSYDFILGPEGDQASVYEQVSSCTEAVLNGYNATVCYTRPLIYMNASNWRANAACVW